MLVIGDKEVEEGTLSPRHRSGDSLNAMKPDEFIQLVQDECRLYH